MKIAYGDVLCAVENCGMNGLSSVRIDDRNWFSLCVEHSRGTDHRLHKGVLDSDWDRHVYEDDRGEWHIGVRPGVEDGDDE